MNLKFDPIGKYDAEDEKELGEFGDLTMLSKAKDVSDEDFENVVSIIDESGNEINCTVNKFIEIFDKQGLDGFVL
ncbi:MAG TPA: hypothetical protein DEO94_06480 [Cyanobacteria bacterium UBA11991]|nr:hypothetical protein [Cyanobacteriota bacterium]HCB11759.1 hypothetical protein [Cyanobacteria bacterium UBA11991]